MVRIPKHRHHKTSGRGVVEINGRQFYTGKFGTQAANIEYGRIIGEWASTGYSSSFGVKREAVTMAMLMVDYLDWAQRYYPPAPNSESVQIKLALRFLAPYEDLTVEEFTPARLKAVRAAMLAAKDARHKLEEKQLTRQYINKLVTKIVRMFKWGVAEELVPSSVHQALAAVPSLSRGRCNAPEAPEVQPVPDPVIQATLPFLRPVVADMVRLQRATGMRPGEIVCLTPSMIDRSGEVWIADLPEHKTRWRGHDRLIYLGPTAQTIVSRYLLRGQDETLFSPREALGCNSTGSRRVVGTSYKTGSYARAIKYGIEKAARQDPAILIPHWTPMMVRHQVGTEVRREFGRESAQVMLGHKKAETTERYYAKPVNDAALAVAAKIG